jgi:lipopolysaccharide transport system ATP-binding protein
MTRAEVARKFDQIVDFAEIEPFIDTPVKRYSSGMYLRLAFSVAAHLDPEILVVDEVLAVGDAAFQKKCMGKMDQVAQEGRTVLFVSHNLAAVRQLCHSALLLTEGEISCRGNTEDIINTYLATTLEDDRSSLRNIRERKGVGDLQFDYLRFEDHQGQQIGGLSSGQPGRIVLGVTGSKPVRGAVACIVILDAFQQKIMYLKSSYVNASLSTVRPGGELVCEIPRVHLAPGRYRLQIWLNADGVPQDHIGDAGSFLVMDGNFFGTGQAVTPGFQVALMDYSWHLRHATDELNSAPLEGVGADTQKSLRGTADI